MKRWIGRWIIGTSTLHTIFAFIKFPETWANIITDGVFNSVGENAEIAAPVFFLLWGLLFYVFGFTIDALEKKAIPLPNPLGWGLFLNGVVAVILIPASGFWLLFPPAIAISQRNRKITKKEEW